MTNPLPFVVILPGPKSKPLRGLHPFFGTRKTYGCPIVFYAARRRKFRITADFTGPSKKKKLILRYILLPIQLMMDNKTTGTVKFFNADKGFGFIKHDDGNKETFVHASGLIDQVKENDRVEFDLQNGKKGLNAVNVKLIR
ncbi:cold shock domain-containing protein [Flavitalea sp. BT771]|uniref:cold-shock protein n=2 Tax=Flavitalea sp. BT771 TaxID=3063329 RepID=UPI0026E15E1F|nr:cold shock domain-containing protein [Flavitalea sp. BT771]MDO6431270.1 cold shock domain-containing protein [Flavitalea sp. BT771]MDV6220178.1 cold shock domain-containing protein [Flavitalea sp. BT771]